jgi:peptidoglycan/xylan/chitin deacetylase (PgdA/CDA1 family)
MRRNIRTFILIISALSGVAAFQSSAFGISYVLSEIEINKCNLTTIGEYNYIKSIIPSKYHSTVDTFIDAVRSGKDSYYEVGLWLNDYQDDIIAASLSTPCGQIYHLVKGDDGQFRLEIDKSYFSITELRQEFPPGEYTLSITLANHTIVTLKATLPNYDSDNFPDFIEGCVTTTGGDVLQLHWSTVQGAGEYEVRAETFPGYSDIHAYYSGNIYLTHPQTLDTTLSGITAGSTDYQVTVQAEQDVVSGQFGIELNSLRKWFVFKNPPKQFMITFDDGPVPGNTENIVNALKNIYVGCEPVKAGFFMVGCDGGCENTGAPRRWYGWLAPWELWRTKGSVYGNSDIVKYVADAGHIIGNHTQHHMWFGWFLVNEQDVNDEIVACNNELKSAPKIFRPPYFVYNKAVKKGAKRADPNLQIIMGAGDNQNAATGDLGLGLFLPFLKNNAANLIREWNRDYPCVLTFHDISPTTANNIAEIIEYLQKEGFTLVHFDPDRLPGSIPSLVHHTTNSIHQSETVTHTVSLDSTVSTATFNISWKGSDLDLVLYKPDGTKIDPNSTLADPNIKYAERDTYEYYTVLDPNPGNWVMEVSGVNVPPEGEKYTIRVEADTNLALFAFADKPDYELNEHINIKAELVNDQNSVTDALVTAKIQRPDGSIDNLTLYDDGTHGDEDPNDGFYANAYNNTSLRGSYGITVSAISEITGEQYERASSLTAMVGSIIYGNVDFETYAVFADHWLAQNCTEPAWCETADLDQSGQVDIFDLGALVEHWLAEYDLCPGDPNKVEPGTCGCGVPDVDVNGDGIPDCGFRYGDVNGDGEISAYDAALAAQCSEGLIELQDLQLFAADVDGNGCVSDADADLIAQYTFGLITVFPVELMNPKPTVVPTCTCP